MHAPQSPSAGNCLVIHLLDSAQGNSLQTWRFADREVVTIGRGEDNDIVIADPQVSRAHAKLVQQNGAWTLISTGRHGTLVNDRLASEVVLQHQTVFRLGASGPMLRFDADSPETRRSETLENINADAFSMMAVDEQRMQQEADEIAGNVLFRDLQEQSRRLRTNPPLDTT